MTPFGRAADQVGLATISLIPERNQIIMRERKLSRFLRKQSVSEANETFASVLLVTTASQRTRRTRVAMSLFKENFSEGWWAGIDSYCDGYDPTGGGVVPCPWEGGWRTGDRIVT